MAEKEHDTKTPEGAFLSENPYADEANRMIQAVIDGPQDPRNPGAEAYLTGAQALATLALAFEQRQARFDLANALSNHAQQTGTV